MASRIPSTVDIGRREFSGITKVLTPDTRAIGSGLTSMGRAIGGIADDVEEYNDRNTDFEVAKAEADFLIAKTQQDKAYEHDQDYKTITERYGKNMGDTLDRLSKTISDPRKAAQFSNRNRVKVEAGKVDADGLAFNRKRDINRAELNDSLNQLKEGALQGRPEDMAQWIDAGGSLFNSAQFEDIYGAEEAGKVKKAWIDDIAKSKLNMMKPRDALNAMGQDWVKNLPVDDQISLKRHFEEKVLDQDAMDWVDANYEKGIEEARKGVSSIVDPLAREATEKRLQYVHNVAQKDFAIEQDELYRRYGGAVIDGKMTVDDIRTKNKDDWDKMTVGMKQNLINTQASAGKRPANTPSSHVLTMLAMKESAKRSGDYSELMEYVQSNSSEFSTSDLNKWGAVAIEGSMPMDVDSALTDTQAMKEQLPANASKDEQAKLLGAIGNWRMSYQAKYNKNPSDKERQDEINSLLLERDTYGWGGTARYKLKGADAYADVKATEYTARYGAGSKQANEAFDKILPIAMKVEEALREQGIDKTNPSYDRLFNISLDSHIEGLEL